MPEWPAVSKEAEMLFWLMWRQMLGSSNESQLRSILGSCPGVAGPCKRPNPTSSYLNDSHCLHISSATGDVWGCVGRAKVYSSLFAAEIRTSWSVWSGTPPPPPSRAPCLGKMRYLDEDVAL